MSLLCCKSHTHVANIKFQPNACSSCFKQYFPFLFGRENIHNCLIVKSIAVASSHCLIESITSFTALKILRYILSSTRSFMINTCQLVGCVENSDRKVKQFRVIPRIASTESSCLLLVWFCNTTPDLYRETVTQRHRAIKTERLGSNGF